MKPVYHSFHFSALLLLAVDAVRFYLPRLVAIQEWYLPFKPISVEAGKFGSCTFLTTSTIPQYPASMQW